MKVDAISPHQSRRGERAMTMVEALVSIVLVSLGFTALCLGMSGGFAVTKHCRENLRATQIMLERLEGIRLYNWNQLCYSNMIPAEFTTYYYPFATNNESKGVVYQGKMQISVPSLTPSATYAGNLRAVTVTLTWTNKNGGNSQIIRSRSMTTYAARNGVQNYVYNN